MIRSIFQRLATQVKPISLRWSPFLRKYRRCLRRRKSTLHLFGFCMSAAGIYKSGMINFSVSPRFSSNECSESNFKALIISMLMANELDEDEVAILTASFQAVYNGDGDTKSWCCTELKNFMKCTEKYQCFQHPQCSSYRKMLKTCLESKKAAGDFCPPKIPIDEACPKDCPPVQARRSRRQNNEGNCCGCGCTSGCETPCEEPPGCEDEAETPPPLISMEESKGCDSCTKCGVTESIPVPTLFGGDQIPEPETETNANVEAVPNDCEEWEEDVMSYEEWFRLNEAEEEDFE